MLRATKIFLAIATFITIIFFTFFVNNLTAQTIDQIVAVVNQQVITAGYLNQAVALTEIGLNIKPTSTSDRLKLRHQVLTQLIDQALELQLAQQNHLTVTPQQLHQAMQQIAASNHQSLSDLKKFIAQSTVSWQFFQQQIKNSLITNQLEKAIIANKISVNQDDFFDQQYQNKINQILNPQLKYHVLDFIVALPNHPTAAQLAKARLQIQQAINTDVFNQDNNINNKNITDLGINYLDQFSNLFIPIIPNLSVGEISQPILAPNGYHLLKLTEIQGAKSYPKVTELYVQAIILPFYGEQDKFFLNNQLNRIASQVNQGGNLVAVARLILATNSVQDLGWINPKNYESGELYDVLKSLPLRKISTVVELSRNRLGLFIVLNRQQKMVLTPTDQEKLTEFIYNQKAIIYLKQWLEKLKSKAYIKILI